MTIDALLEEGLIVAQNLSRLRVGSSNAGHLHRLKPLFQRCTSLRTLEFSKGAHPRAVFQILKYLPAGRTLRDLVIEWDQSDWRQSGGPGEPFLELESFKGVQKLYLSQHARSPLSEEPWVQLLREFKERGGVVRWVV